MRTARLTSALPLGLLGALCAGCDSPAATTPALDSGANTVIRDGSTTPPTDAIEPPGTAVAVDAGFVHPPVSTTPLDDPSLAGGHVGRVARRIDVDQLRVSLRDIVGAVWTAPRRVRTTDANSGEALVQNADMLDAFAETLGRPNYLDRTSASIDVSVTFTKLANDAVRAACREGITLDLTRPTASRYLMREASERDTLIANPDAVRRNMQRLVMRFWSVDPAQAEADVTALTALFSQASTRTGATPADGWRAVCISLATDPRFLAY